MVRLGGYRAAGAQYTGPGLCISSGESGLSSQYNHRIMKKIIALALILAFFPINSLDAAVKKPAPKKDPVAELRKEYEAKVKELQKKIDELKESITQKQSSPTISASEIAPYLQSAALIYCYDFLGNEWHGTGTFVNFTDGWAVVSNNHVLESGNCVAMERGINDTSVQSFNLSRDLKVWNQNTDLAVAYITGANAAFPNSSTSSIYSSASFLRDCGMQLPLGTSVAVIGYPASAIDGVPTRILTTGVIAGYNFGTRNGLPYLNYYLSAKADSGNSGGIVIAKDDYGLCQAGITTWVQSGNLDRMTIAQNIWNIRYVK